MQNIRTDHAKKRMAQRGVQADAVEAIIHFGDRCIFVGNGCSSVSMTRTMASDLTKAGEISPAIADRVANLAVVVANDNDTIITVVRPKNRKAARSYFNSKGRKPRARNRRAH